MMHSIEVVNEYSLKVHFHQKKPEQFANKVRALSLALEAHQNCIRGIIPAYNTLTIILNPNYTPQILESRVETLLQDLDQQISGVASKHHELPCYYGDDAAWDLKNVAKLNNLSRDEVVRIHCGKSYRVFALGFSPGFPYLGFVAPEIASPRHASPRRHVPQGAVGIAGEQTGIYPQASPGGWQIIGCCPTQLFNIESKNAPLSKLTAGDTVSFIEINKDEFISLGGILTSSSEAKHVR